MEQVGNKHYIRIDDQDRVLLGFSDAFQQPSGGDICIAENAGRHFELSGEVNPPLVSDEGIPLYKWDGIEVQERTEQEIQDDIDALPPPPKTQTEIIRELENLVVQLSLERGE